MTINLQARHNFSKPQTNMAAVGHRVTKVVGERVPRGWFEREQS
jgi:hypothetical protein